MDLRWHLKRLPRKYTLIYIEYTLIYLIYLIYLNYLIYKPWESLPKLASARVFVDQ